MVVVVVETEQRFGSKPKRDQTRREEGEEEGVTDGDNGRDRERDRERERELAEAERAAQHALHRTTPHALHPFHRPFLPTQRSAPVPKVQQQQPSSPAAQKKRGGGGALKRALSNPICKVLDRLFAIRVPLFRAKASPAPHASCSLRGRPTRFSTRDALGSCARFSSRLSDPHLHTLASSRFASASVGPR